MKTEKIKLVRKKYQKIMKIPRKGKNFWR